MTKTIGTAIAGAVLCALALAGCNGNSTAGAGTGNGGGVSATTPAAGTQGGGGGGADADAGVPSGTPSGAAAVDSELNSVDKQLGVANGDLKTAEAAPSDGD